MAIPKSILRMIAFSTVTSIISAANCNTNQYRKAGDPTGQQISDALLGTNGATLNAVCNGGFPPDSSTLATFNSGSLVYNITRTDPTQPLQNCEAAFQDIIQQCITGGNYWGGDWSLSGDLYAIYDQGWPDHTLPAELLSSYNAAMTASSGIVSSAGGAPTSGGQTVVVTTINGSPITETFVPTTVSGITKATTTSTNIDGVIVPLILGPLGIGWIPFVPAGGVPPVPAVTPPPTPDEGGDDPNNQSANPSNQPSANSALTFQPSSSQPVSSMAPISQDLDDGYQVGVCGGDPSAATRKTTFTTSGPGSSSTSSQVSSAPNVPPPQTVTTGCNICILPYGSTDPNCTPIPGCSPSTTVAPTSTTATAVFPSGTGISCGQSSTGGARLSDCLEALASVEIPNDNTQICTNDNGNTCIASGDSLGGSPLVTTSSFCWVGGNSGCAVVIANKLASFGFPGFSCISGAILNNFIKNAANACNNGLDAYAIAQGPNGYDSLCLTGSQDPGLCGA